MATTITHMLNFGRTWTVKLSCGCARKGVTGEDVQREQLYIGKTVQCDKHRPRPRKIGAA